MHPSSLQFRRDLAVLTGHATTQLETGWRDFQNPRDTRDWLIEYLSALTGKYGLAAAALAADHYDLLRDERNVRRVFAAVAAEPPKEDQAAALARFAVGSLFGATPDTTAALHLAQGGTQRLIANTARDTLTRSAVLDPSCKGWQRVGVGDCDFCRMLIGRGAVYREATADFAAHDRCECTAEPVFGS